jgi:hypothetical protein
MNWDLVTRSDTHNVKNGIYLKVDGVDVQYVDSVGINGGSAHIPPLQGFFVKTRATDTYITIPDNAREHNATPRYKSAHIIPLIRLTLVSPRSQDEMVIRLNLRPPIILIMNLMQIRCLLLPAKGHSFILF